MLLLALIVGIGLRLFLRCPEMGDKIVEICDHEDTLAIMRMFNGAEYCMLCGRVVYKGPTKPSKISLSDAKT